MARSKIRLYVDQPLGVGQSIELESKQAHYLFSVMRLKEQASVRVFNGRDGEFLAEVVRVAKRGGLLVVTERSRPFEPLPDVMLIFAPIKKGRTDFLVEKAVELGAGILQPVQTDFTNSERIRADKMHLHVIEAAEQCEAVALPEIRPLGKLRDVIETLSGTRKIAFCDEAADAGFQGESGASDAAWAILIGPEGGFSEQERAWLLARPEVVRISLGPRILRAETAALAALTLWQAQIGDWDKKGGLI